MLLRAFFLLCLAWHALPCLVQAQHRKMEYLDRGLVAIPAQGKGVYLSWRLFADDEKDIAFNIYREDTKGLHKINSSPVSNTTDFVDSTANVSESQSWILKSVIQGKEIQEALCKNPDLNHPYLSIPIKMPPPGKVSGKEYTYAANDCSVADLDGDGQYEIVLKWEPSNAKNPPQTGFTGKQYLDAYRLDGTFLWRIDLGINIRAGAAYTQFLVYDLDGDGKAELVCKTADGTKDGRGNVIGQADKDWRFEGPESDSRYGKVIQGPEYLTVFDGLTGKAVATSTYVPGRDPLDGWGGIGGNGRNDSVGSRSDRFTACIAYLDGVHPSVVMVRGWYGRTVLAAWDFRNGKLNHRWTFDSKEANNPYSGMANHNLSVADVDQDGRDEICVGAMTVDDDGRELYSTGLRHGDALHLTDIDPMRPGLEVFGIHESEGQTLKLETPGVAMYDAKTGEIIWAKFPGTDVGRGVAADIDPRYPGLENWGGPGGLRDAKGNQISANKPSSTNFLVWWDADLSRELLDRTFIDKWNPETQQSDRLLNAEGCASNNGSKATPCLSADILGDWREEVIWRSADNKELRIYCSNIPAKQRLVTLMQDPQYRLSVAWQNVAYNQPPHPGFFLGSGMHIPEKPNIQTHQPK